MKLKKQRLLSLSTRELKILSTALGEAVAARDMSDNAVRDNKELREFRRLLKFVDSKLGET